MTGQQASWTLRLPWTSPPLSLNQRMHWAVKARRTREVRQAAALLARQARIPACERVRVQLVQVPRDRRRRDTDNLSATLKALADGIVDAGVVPDDVPAFMAKPEPIIAEPDSRDPHLRLLVTDLGPAS